MLLATQKLTKFRPILRSYCAKPPKFGVTLAGTASSPGFYQGEAVIIKNPKRDEARVTDGCVLVCSVALDASWNYIISKCGALVTQIGGKISHGPMVARRLGIPCVSGVEEIWDYVSDGDQIIVRGNSGTIQILGKEEKPKKKDTTQIFTQPEIQELLKKEAFQDLPPQPQKE